MRKILTASQLQATDEYTITHEPITSIDLMERASQCFVREFLELFPRPCNILVLVGPGNNGGDGLAIARLLLEKGYAVEVGSVAGNSLSKDAQVNERRLNLPIRSLAKGALLSAYEVIIDALFGSGLSRPVEGAYKDLIDGVNASNQSVVAVDLPSGLMADQVIEDTAVVRANYTLTFQCPKLTFLIPETGKFCGDVRVLDIGLAQEFIERIPSQYFFIEREDVLLPARDKFAHKGRYGHVQVVAGSKGKMGAAVLCTRAALLAGVGLATAHIPARGESIMQIAVPEAMVSLDDSADVVTSGVVLPSINALCIGPGLGKDERTVQWLCRFLEKNSQPLVLDADALNILSEHHELFDFIAGKAILTPHLGELARLIGPTANGLERIEKSLLLAAKHDVVVVIKGAHSSVIAPDGNVYFNSTGNPGMAKGGSGDVLAGLIAGFLAQGFSRESATRQAVYYHGAAGDHAKKALGEHSIMASDLLHSLPQVICNA